MFPARYHGTGGLAADVQVAEVATLAATICTVHSTLVQLYCTVQAVMHNYADMLGGK